MKLVMHKNGCIVDVEDPVKPQIVVRLVYADEAMAAALFDAVVSEMVRRGELVEAVHNRVGAAR